MTVISKSLQNAVVKRAANLGITGTPNAASHDLGLIKLGDKKEVRAHVIHAVDPIITDGKHVVLIDRKNPPGKGKPALPGGFIDPTSGGGVESATQAAVREALEEVGVKLKGGTLIGQRNMNRPYDIRVAKCDLPQYGIKKDDIFMVSTQAVRFDVPDLVAARFVAGDDAKSGSARAVPVSELTREAMGIPDHYDMITHAIADLEGTHRPLNTIASEKPTRKFF